MSYKYDPINRMLIKTKDQRTVDSYSSNNAKEVFKYLDQEAENLKKHFEKLIKNASTREELSKINTELDRVRTNLGNDYLEIMNVISNYGSNRRDQMLQSFYKLDSVCFDKYTKTKDSITKDMPLSFKSNLNKSALKSNVKNIIAQPNNQNFIDSLMSNLDSIQSDRLEWNDYSRKNMFNDYSNLKLICKKLCKEYIDILNNVSDNRKISQKLRNAINRCILNLDADMSNIFR